jgi:hypothetical protein
MENEKDKDLLEYTFLSFLNLRARFEANEVIMNAILDTVMEHAPELMDPLKERINGVAEIKDIQIKNSYTSGESEIFHDHINMCTNRFYLIEEGSRFISKKIKFEEKND